MFPAWVLTGSVLVFVSYPFVVASLMVFMSIAC